MKKVHERFLEYVKIYTTSDPMNDSCPSTLRQLDLAKYLVKELNDIGLKEVSLDENGYVMAKLFANTDINIPNIGFIAHMDTSPDITGENVHPKIIENYDGKEIILNDIYTLNPEEFPEILSYKGQDIIVTDGTTLLGADDKAGIAEIVTAMEYLVNNPEIKHGNISICFTPDEEIGRGANLFDVKKFDAKFAYTIDGGEIGELEYENFNAATLNVHIVGKNVHPGTAKDKMINALELGIKFNLALPIYEKPEHTTHYQGFYHLVQMNGDTEKADLTYIIREHDKKKFEDRKILVAQIADRLNELYKGNWINIEIIDMYYNMKEKIEPVIEIVELAKNSMEMVGVKPLIKPIRGGTDGARLSFMGLPCPNIFTGGHNFHSRYEYIPIQSMEKAVSVIVQIVENNR